MHNSVDPAWTKSSVCTIHLCVMESDTHNLTHQLWSTLMILCVINLCDPHTRLTGFPTDVSHFH